MKSDMNGRELRPGRIRSNLGCIAIPPTYAKPNEVNNAINHTSYYSRSYDAVIRVYDEAGNVIETQKHAGEFKEL